MKMWFQYIKQLSWYSPSRYLGHNAFDWCSQHILARLAPSYGSEAVIGLTAEKNAVSREKIA